MDEYKYFMNLQLFIHHIEPCESLVQPVVNGYTTKPRIGGIWTSTYLPDHTSAWFSICERIPYKVAPKEASWYLLHPKPNLRVLEIDSFGDCIDLYKNYSRPNIDFPEEKRMSMLDFELLQHDFDGVHLTFEGELATRNSEIFPNMAEWDCESTLWFRWVFNRIEKINPLQYGFISENKMSLYE